MDSDPDPRPVIAARLDTRFMDFLSRSGSGLTQSLLDRHIPEGAPWTADWHEPDEFGRTLTMQAGAVTEWLARHPEEPR
jgi:hypothetical protein